MSLIVSNKPIYAIIVGKGRTAHTHLGVKTGGAMDLYAYHIANQLLNNHTHTAMIELNFGGLVLEALCDVLFAITGAVCEATIDTRPIAIWQTHIIRRGESLNIGRFLSGSRVYIAISGGFDIPPDDMLFADKRLKLDDKLELKAPSIVATRRLKSSMLPSYDHSLTLRITLSYQHEDFDDEQKAKLFDSEYIVSKEISRMGYKLVGEAITPRHTGVVSQGICHGAVQIPKDGQPIVLLADRQTIGGYPIIGVVLGVDCSKLSQASPDTKIKFRQISFEEATNISKKFYSQLL